MTTTASNPTAPAPRPLAARVRPALLTGALTVAYYASPDVVRHRPLRGVAKTVLMGAITAVSVDDWRRERATTAPAGDAVHLDHDLDHDRDGDDRAHVPTAELVRRIPAGRGAALAAVAGGAMTASVLVTVAAERWIHRRGQARAAGGARLPHTLPALLWGGIAAAAMLIPTPETAEPA